MQEIIAEDCTKKKRKKKTCGKDTYSVGEKKK